MKKQLFIFTLFLVSAVTSQAQISYVMPVYDMQVYQYGMQFKKPEMVVNGFTMIETIVYKTDEVKIKLPDPILKIKDSTYSVRIGFAIYNHNDSLLGMAPDLYGGRTMPADLNLDYLTLTLTFKGVKEDSSRIKLVFFGGDNYSGDSFKIIQHFTVLNEKTVNNNVDITALFTSTINKTEEIVMSTKYEFEDNSQRLEKDKFIVDFTFKKEVPNNIYLEKLVAYAKDGTIVWEDKDATLDMKDIKCNLTTSKNAPPLPKTAYILHWELASTTDGMFNMGGQVRLK